MTKDRGRTLTEQLIQTPEEKRLFLQERTIIWFTEKICELMEKEDISEEELARRLKMSKRKLLKILDGRKKITLRMLSDIFYHLGYCVEAKERRIEDVFSTAAIASGAFDFLKDSDEDVYSGTDGIPVEDAKSESENDF